MLSFNPFSPNTHSLTTELVRLNTEIDHLKQEKEDLTGSNGCLSQKAANLTSGGLLPTVYM